MIIRFSILLVAIIIGGLAVFTFFDIAQAADTPTAPTNLTLLDRGDDGIGASWTTTTANYTMLRVKMEASPINPSDGQLFYYGDGQTANSSGYNLNYCKYYVSAWGFDTDNITFSSEYATASIGGYLTERLDVLAGYLTSFYSYGQYLFGLGIVCIVTILAFWKSEERLLSVLAGLAFMVYGFGLWSLSVHWSIIAVVVGICIFTRPFWMGKGASR